MQKILVQKGRDNPFVMIAKDCINDNTVSWRAKGLLVYMLSKPDDWQVYEQDLINQAREGRDAVRRAMQELVKAGYVVKPKQQMSNGRFLGIDYIVTDKLPSPEKPPTVIHPLTNINTEPSVHLVSAGKIGKKEKMIPHNEQQYNKLKSVLSSR